MDKPMKKYTYTGPVMRFNECVANEWTDVTYAPTKAKARSNLAYKFKKQFNLVPSARITLPGKIEEET